MPELVQEYSSALYSLSVDEHIESRILGEVRALVGIFKSNQEYIEVLNTPSIPKSERLGSLDSIFSEKIHPYLLSFFKILVENNRANLIVSCLEQYINLWYLNSGIYIADVTTAYPLEQERKIRLQTSLEKKIGSDLELRFHVDPSIIGGVSIVVNGVKFSSALSDNLLILKQHIDNKII